MAGSAPAPTRVTIVVLNYNGLDQTIPDTVNIVLVDNASSVDPTAEARRANPAIEVIRNDDNLGYAGGNNCGIRHALAQGADFILILNNDTIVAPSIVRDLIDTFRANPSLGVVGPVVNFMDEPQTVMTDGVAFNPGPGADFFKRIVIPIDPAAPALSVDIVNGCCMMLSADMVKRVGDFDEDFFIVHEESDLCLRARRAGFECAVLGKTLVWHKGSSSFERSGRQLQRYFDARNLYHLLRRHTGRVSLSRSISSSLYHYLLYVFYRYDIELDAGKTAAASAVLDGLYDGLTGRYGKAPSSARPGRRVLGAVFGAARQLARAKRRPPKTRRR
jgi:GT2 family glycosyltransferase